MTIEDGPTLAAKLRYVDPTRPPGVIGRAYAALAATRVARFISRHVNWKFDPVLLRVTRGRFASTLVFPTAVLETRGARSGALRRNAIIYFHDGDLVTIVASNAGDARHPAWFHNLCAHPDVTFGEIPMHATVVHDEGEREDCGCSRIVSSPRSRTTAAARPASTERSRSSNSCDATQTGSKSRPNPDAWRRELHHGRYRSQLAALRQPRSRKKPVAIGLPFMSISPTRVSSSTLRK